MKEAYKINRTIGWGQFIEVYNFIGLNEIGHYRFRSISRIKSESLVGVWKPKTNKVDNHPYV